MASNSTVQVQHYQQQQPPPQPSSQHHCKECGLFFDSGKSLEVHLQYHKENLLNKWATQATQSGTHAGTDETNNNNTKSNNNKREFNSHPNTIAAAADSSDAMLKANNKSPEYISRNTPEAASQFGHPPTPQSYHSASSPYQNPDNSAFSPTFQNYQAIKQERASPLSHFQSYSAANQHFGDSQYYNMDAQQQQQPGYPQDYPIHKLPQSAGFRYHPYQHQGSYERNTQVTSSSPVYPPQPTPSPSPKQCDKCGYVCESASQLIEHLNVAHPPTPASHFQQGQTHFPFGQTEVKTEEESQSEILDLDSHKVHQVYQAQDDQDDRQQNGDINGHNPHSVSAMLSSWPHNAQQHRIFMSAADQKIYQQNGLTNNISEKMFQQDQKLFQPHQMRNTGDYMANGVTTTTQDSNSPNMNMNPAQMNQSYRPFDQMGPDHSAPVISSTQVPNHAAPKTGPPPPIAKGNWKSNEARRPKTYNCSACNKWFTSSGHLKRHYNTTLHKNAVKSSGQPDPASLPISAHHHPGRDSGGARQDSSSPGPSEESRGEDSGLSATFERNPIPGLIQQPPNGPYDRQPPIHHPPLHSPMGQNSNPNSLTNLSAGSPPNGEAGPSVSHLDHSRGLLSLSTPNTPLTQMVPSNQLPGFSLLNHHHHQPHLMSMEGSQQVYQTMSPPAMSYPNGSAPHVMQVTAINSQPGSASLITTGELSELEPLPSFSQFHRFGVLAANVGGMGPVTGSYSLLTTSPIFTEQSHYSPAEPRLSYRHDEDDFKITVHMMVDHDEEQMHDDPLEDPLYIKKEESLYIKQEEPYSPPNHNNNNFVMHSHHESEMYYKKIKIEPASPPPQPQQREEVLKKAPPAVIKKDYESGSPVITSTGSPMHKSSAPGVHKCFDCDKIFNKACYLTQHNKTFHSGDKPFKCTRCGKRFSSDPTYQSHLGKHAGDKPYKCELCPKQFNHKTDLRRHMCLHTGQKPYACDTCGKGFIRKDHMLKHCETHNRKPHHVKNVVPAAVVH